MDIALTPVRIAISKPARKTYLNTLLFLTTSTILAGLAVIAYVLFYFNYVPQIGIERVIHLQYGDGPHPYGVAKLDYSLVSQQPYDIAVSIHLPRSPPNVAQGNFMLTMSLLKPSYIPPNPALNQRPKFPKIPPPLIDNGPTYSLTKAETILTSRRPAILTYTSRLVSLSERIFQLPLYILGLRKESEKLLVPMAESERFEKGRSNVPEYVMLELQAGQEVQVYDVRVNFKARFEGLRWIMYHHRIISFIIGTSAFWLAEVISTLLGWVLLRSIFSSPSPKETKKESQLEDTETERVKREPDTEDDPDLSDTPRTFPTYGRQKPLRYEPKIKDENSEEYVLDETAIQPLNAEADDEDEDLEGVFDGRGNDSGLGTSFSEGGGRGRGITRRRSRGGRLGGGGS